MGLRTRYHFAYRPQGVNAWARVKRKGSESGGIKRKGRRIIRLTITAFALALSLLGAFFLHSYSTYARIVDARLTRGYLISRAGIYAAPRTLRPVLVHAITSIEDRRFFDHHGVDIFGVVRALLRNAGDERMGQGGSTITQQLVKNTYLTPERTLRRKYAEAMLAFTIERRLSKEEIFALYCNEIYLGQRGAFAVRGVDQAARVYFGKQLKDLSLAEAATIAGMIQGPARYSPVHHADTARARRNTVLGTMARDGFITLDQAANAAKESLTIADFDPARESDAPYFIDYVNRMSAAERHPAGGA